MDTNPAELCAVILAGGQSNRMGRNKAFIPVEGRPLIQLLAERMQSLTGRIVISANDPLEYSFLNLPVVRDVYAGRGPLAGLHGAMRQVSAFMYLLLACDLPNLTVSLPRRMIEIAGDYDIVAPVTADGAHPLCAVYRRTCLPVVEAHLEQGNNRMTDLLADSSLRVKRLDANEGHFHDENLLNLNTPEDLFRAAAGRPESSD
jgi:molybdopterin-guanine dinucleotide biosynthesis protein A